MRQRLRAFSSLRFVSFAELGSTNEKARELASNGDLGPVWLRADIQTSGRGRRGREWTSSKGNLFCTGLYPHFGDLQAAAKLSFVAALAVFDVVETYAPRAVTALKWPNDVLIEGKKVSGILIESGTYEGKIWTAIGIGINLVSHPDDAETAATHILEHVSQGELEQAETIMTGPDATLAVLSARFDHWRYIFKTDGFEPIRQEWTARACHIPGPVRVRLAKESFQGEALGLGEKGELQVRLQDGTIRDVHAGDVFF